MNIKRRLVIFFFAPNAFLRLCALSARAVCFDSALNYQKSQTHTQRDRERKKEIEKGRERERMETVAGVSAA